MNSFFFLFAFFRRFSLARGSHCRNCSLEGSPFFSYPNIPFLHFFPFFHTPIFFFFSFHSSKISNVLRIKKVQYCCIISLAAVAANQITSRNQIHIVVNRKIGLYPMYTYYILFVVPSSLYIIRNIETAFNF